MSKKIKTNFKKHLIDKLIQIIGSLIVVASFVYIIIYYSQLPDEIPIHYGLDGKPDDFANKSSIWSIPILSLLMFIGLTYLSKIQIPYNFAAKSVVKNAAYLKIIKYRFIQALNAIIAFIFFFLTYKTVQIGLGNDTGLGNYFIYLVIIGMFAPIVVYLFLALRKA